MRGDSLLSCMDMHCFVVLWKQIMLSDTLSYVLLALFPERKEEPPSCSPNQEFATGFIVQLSIPEAHFMSYKGAIAATSIQLALAENAHSYISDFTFLLTTMTCLI